MGIDSINLAGLQHQIVMLRKMSDAVEAQGKQALRLIESAPTPVAPSASSSGVGSLIDIKA